MTSTAKLSVILPAYNEELTIAGTLADLERYLGSTHPDYEVIVVDDGSTDNTAPLVQRWANRNSRYRLMRHRSNRGYGAALRTGFASATGDLIFFMDADGQFDIRDLDRFFPLIERYDGVIGFRLRRQDHAIRRLNAFGWNLLTRLILGLPFRDIDCAFKLFHRRVLESLHIESNGAMVNAEMLARIRARGFHLAQAGVRHLPRQAGLPTGGNPRVILRAFQELFALYGQLKQELRAQHQFSRG